MSAKKHPHKTSGGATIDAATAGSAELLISAACRDALQNWLAGLTALAGATTNTTTAYRGDLVGFLSFMTLHKGSPQGFGALAQITTAEMRAWMAEERNAGVAARSLARKLSAVKSFYRWLAEREGFEPTAVLSARAPKFQKKLPRPIPEEAAREVLSRISTQSDTEWVNARDLAVVTLLYGCGLRISEALGLTGADAPLPSSLRILGKGGKERMVPVLEVARRAVDSYLQLCPYPCEAHGPLFRGVRGGALNPGQIQAPWPRSGRNLDCLRQPPPMLCATALPPICLRPVAICGRSKNSLAMPHYRQRRPMLQWIRRI